MKTVGIAMDEWKLPIFERILWDNGFDYINDENPPPYTYLLKVTVPNDKINEITATVNKANRACRRYKVKRLYELKKEAK